MRRWLRSLQTFFSNLLGGGQAWGYARLLLMLGLLALFAALSQRLWSKPGAEASPGFRHLIPALAAVIGGLLVTANYIRRLYHLPKTRQGLRYLWASMTSLGLPGLVIQNGKPEIEVGQVNLVQHIGGPGYLNIRPGSAVVLESLSRPTNTYGAGRHFISRQERIREIISLADQHGMTEKLPCTSKDGLQVNVQRLQYRYRLLSSRRSAGSGMRTMQDPYPFLPRAAHDLAYRRSVNPGGMVAWDFAVKVAVEGILTDYVSTHWFDQVTAPLPRDEDPRARMNGEMSSLRGRLAGLGTELLWFDIGNFEPASPVVENQRVETWGTKWLGSADVEAAKADAQRLVAEELGRAEAQADMVNSLIHALDQVSLSGDPRQNLHSLIVLRTAQLLETMVESSKSGARHTPPEQPMSVGLYRMLKDE